MLNDRAVTNLKQPAETLQMTYQRLKLYDINSLYKFETVKFLKLLQEGKLPTEFKDFIQPINHHHHTRASMRCNYQLPFARTDLGKSSLKFRGIQVWNDLPFEIKNQHGEKK